MNTFNQKLEDNGMYPLTANSVSTLQVNIGYKCNLTCSHCHVEASPSRTEMMSLSTMSHVLSVLRENAEIDNVDITGGSPELNPYFRYFVKSCADMGRQIIVRSNLVIFSESGMDDIPAFLADNGVKIVASFPCYSEDGVDNQRGKGSYQKAVKALKELNGLGYGKEGTGLILDLMFNPASAGIAPDQHMLENAYREKLMEMHGIIFNNLIALSNMPLGRLGKSLSEDENMEYVKTLMDKFNPMTVGNVMCRDLVSVSPDGHLYDCDFWQMMNLPVKSDCADLESFDYDELSKREIVTNSLCFMCTAGAGASCSGALT